MDRFRGRATSFAMKTMILFMLLNVSCAMASPKSAQKEFMQSFATPQMTFMSKAFEKTASNPHPSDSEGLLRFTPPTAPAAFSAACDPQNFETSLQATAVAAEKTALIQKYFQTCEKEVSYGNKSGWSNMFYSYKLDFDWRRNSLIEPVLFHLKNGKKLRGLLALKGDLKPRPLVILRVGIFAGTDSLVVEKGLAMQFFEQGASNVLILENTASAGYISRNPGFEAGGVYEGPQDLEVAALVRDPSQPLSRVVSSVHMVATSLGGHGMFFAAALDQRRGTHLIDSYVGLCPVVDLKKNLQRHLAPTFKGQLIDYLMSSQLAGLKPQLGKTEGDPSVPENVRGLFFAKALNFTNKTYETQRSMMVRSQEPFAQKASFWEASEPWSWFKDVRAPMTVITSTIDPLVPPAENAEVLPKLLPDSSSNLSSVNLERGLHCNFVATYRWQTISALVKGSLFNPATVFPAQTAETQTLSLSRVFPKEGSKIKFDGRVIDRDGVFIIPVRAQGGTLVRNAILRIPRSQVDFEFRNKELTRADMTMVTRWIHANVKLSLTGDTRSSAVVATWKH